MSRRQEKEQREAERQRAIERVWGIVDGYQLESKDLVDRYGIEGDADIFEQVAFEIDLRERKTRGEAGKAARANGVSNPTANDGFSSGHPALADRDEVILCLRSGMKAWLTYYFRIDDESPHARLLRASEELKKASSQMHLIWERLEASNAEVPEDRRRAMRAYVTGLSNWGRGMDLIATGCRLDQEVRAIDGFELFNQGTEMVQEHIEGNGDSHSTVLIESLDHLERLRPPVRVARGTIRQAKVIWRQALLAAAWVVD